MPKGNRRDVERIYSKEAFIAQLRRLADALEQGRAFRIRVAGERVRIPARATFSIEHERERGVEELEFQVRWTRSALGPASRKQRRRARRARSSARAGERAT
ncbi:hypothetical protein HRbin10_01242 [bacterium HR10]|nr:hypothetical protein HRbin10_01242 [bacterium HR10]